MFPEFIYSMRLVAIMYHRAGSGKSKMAATKLAIRASQLVHKMATKSQVLYLCFGGSAIQWNLWQYPMTKPEEIGIRKSNMLTSKLVMRVTQHVK